MTLNYNSPRKGEKSSIDGKDSDQVSTFYWIKKALVEAKKEQFFTPLANAITLPKHYGDTVKRYEMVPLLDNRNVNDQGIDATGAKIVNGNLWGSSRDIGTILASTPLLPENGGKVNRVGFTRILLESSITKLGVHYDFSREAFDFDSDSTLKEHLARELINGATQMYESFLQIDLIAGAGVVAYPGMATTNADMTAEGVVPSIVTYAGLMRLDRALTANRSPRQLEIITGSTKISTETISSARILYVGPDVTPLLRSLKDEFGNKAFIPAHKYAAGAGRLLNGEIGAIDCFRIIEVPEMHYWEGEGAEVINNPGYRSSVNKITGKECYDVFPMLTIGKDSFSTIGFQSSGKSVKFDIITKMPGRETADRNHDPYGETGFSSLKFYYGTLVYRPQRIGLYKTLATI